MNRSFDLFDTEELNIAYNENCYGKLIYGWAYVLYFRNIDGILRFFKRFILSHTPKIQYSETCLKLQLKNRQNKGLKDRS